MTNPQENVERFEDIIAEYTGAKYAIATDCCTNSIFLTLKYFEAHPDIYGEKRPIHLPKHTYLSIPQAVQNAGYKKFFTKREWVGVYQLEPYPLWDSATLFHKDMYTRSNNGFVCVSFHIKKRIPIGRGGMILTDDESAANWLRQARYDGRKGHMFNDIDDIEVCGYHMYMTPEQAARGIQLFYGLEENDKPQATWENYPDVSEYSCFQSI
tara:strand:+ start:551 stop:1183 length:633 start_codon:yes stop_codon:yes gene_type:complete